MIDKSNPEIQKDIDQNQQGTFIQAYSKAFKAGMDGMNAMIQDILLSGMAQEAEFDDQRMEIPEIARVIVTPEEVEIYTFDDFLYLISRNDQKVKKMKLIDGEMVIDEEWKPIRPRNTVIQQAVFNRIE